MDIKLPDFSGWGILSLLRISEVYHRLRGALISWLLILVGGVAAIWATYFYVMYQVFVIPVRREIRDTNTRHIPLMGMAAILGVAVILVTMLLTGPYSQFQLF